MSVSVALPEPIPLSFGERLAGVAVVVAASVLLAVARGRPGTSVGVLTLICRNGRPAALDRALWARRVVETVSLRCAGPHGCLPRSLAVLLLCRLSGDRVVWRVGAHSPPPSLHAWVEARGGPVGEPFDPRVLYTPIITVGEMIN